MAQELIPAIKSALLLPKIGRGSIHVLRHNFSVFKQSLLVNFFWIGLEPLVYLYAIGYGVGRLIPEIQGMTYFDYFTPGLIAITAMIVPSYETTHGTYARAHFDHTFSSLYLAPISGKDLFFGELLWGMLKGVLSVSIISVVLFFIGKISLLKALILIILALPICWFFSSMGLLFNSIVKNSEKFIIYQAGIIIPMAMLSGAYFPVEYLPDFFAFISKSLPLFHCINIIRSYLTESIGASLYISAIYILLIGYIFSNVSVTRLNNKISHFLN